MHVWANICQILLNTVHFTQFNVNYLAKLLTYFRRSVTVRCMRGNMAWVIFFRVNNPLPCLRVRGSLTVRAFRWKRCAVEPVEQWSGCADVQCSQWSSATHSRFVLLAAPEFSKDLTANIWARAAQTRQTVASWLCHRIHVWRPKKGQQPIPRYGLYA